MKINYWKYRRFGGIKYYAYVSEWGERNFEWNIGISLLTKAGAQEEARELRKRGYYVRIVQDRHGFYSLYVRKRKKARSKTQAKNKSQKKRVKRPKKR